MLDWFGDHEALVGWLFALSVLMFVGSLILLPILIVRMPADYFSHRRPPAESWRGRHSAIRMVGLISKNAVGAIILIAGIVMLAVPGQGILAILIGLSLLNIPGKRALELRIIGNRMVLRAINALRAKAHRPPLVLRKD